MTRRMRLILSCGCAVAVAFAFTVYAREVRADAERSRAEAIAAYGGELIELSVATRTLEAGELLAPSDVKKCEWLTDLVPEGALTDVEEHLGTVLSAPVAKGAPFTTLNFRDATDAADVPKGFVAVTIPVNDRLGVSREVVVGTRVVAYRVGDGAAQVISTNATVLSSPAAYGSALTSTQTMTLAVLPECVSDVLLAGSDGSLRIVLPSQDLSLDSAEGDQAPVDVAAQEDAAPTGGVDATGEADTSAAADSLEDAPTQVDTREQSADTDGQQSEDVSEAPPAQAGEEASADDEAAEEGETR